MRTVTGLRLRKWLLLGMLAFALVGMHHVPAAPCGSHVAVAAHASTDTQECHAPEGGHDLLHLCLMVLAFAVTFLLGWLFLGVDTAPERRRVPLGWWRPPGPAGRSLLMSVCVLRT